MEVLFSCFSRGLAIGLLLSLLAVGAPAYGAPTLTPDSPYRIELDTRSIVLDMQKEQQEQGSFSLTVDEGSFSRLNIFELRNPRRIVIDLYGGKTRFNRTLQIKESTKLSRFRVGSHPEKIRIVADLQPTFQGAFQWSVARNVLSLSFVGKDGARLPAFGVLSQDAPELARTEQTVAGIHPQTDEKTVVEEKQLDPLQVIRVSRLPMTPPEPTGEKNPNIQTSAAGSIAQEVTNVDDSATRASLSLEELQPTREPVAVVAPATSPDSAVEQLEQLEQQKPKASSVVAPLIPVQEDPVAFSQQLQEIRFEYEGKDKKPVIRLALQERPEFTLTRQDRGEYRISVENCSTAGKHLELPYFPPQDFHGFQRLQVGQTGEELDIVVHVDRGTRLTSLVKGNSIVLRILRSESDSS